MRLARSRPRKRNSERDGRALLRDAPVEDRDAAGIFESFEYCGQCRGQRRHRFAHGRRRAEQPHRLASSGHVSPPCVTLNHSSRAAVCGSSSISCTVRPAPRHAAARQPRHRLVPRQIGGPISASRANPAGLPAPISATICPSRQTTSDTAGALPTHAVCVSHAVMSCIDRSTYCPRPVRSRRRAPPAPPARPSPLPSGRPTISRTSPARRRTAPRPSAPTSPAPRCRRPPPGIKRMRAEPRDAAGDQPRIERRDALRREAAPRQRARLQVSISTSASLISSRSTPVSASSRRSSTRLFLSEFVCEEVCLPALRRRPVAHASALRRLDLDHCSAEARQHARAAAAPSCMADLDDADAASGAFGGCAAPRGAAGDRFSAASLRTSSRSASRHRHPLRRPPARRAHAQRRARRRPRRPTPDRAGGRTCRDARVGLARIAVDAHDRPAGISFSLSAATQSSMLRPPTHACTCASTSPARASRPGVRASSSEVRKSDRSMISHRRRHCASLPTQIRIQPSRAL